MQSLKHPQTEMTLIVGNPKKISQKQSPVPWGISIIVLVIGIATWVLSARLELNDLREASRVLVYLPIGNMFGMTSQIRRLK